MLIKFLDGALGARMQEEDAQLIPRQAVKAREYPWSLRISRVAMSVKSQKMKANDLALSSTKCWAQIPWNLFRKDGRTWPMPLPLPCSKIEIINLTGKVKDDQTMNSASRMGNAQRVIKTVKSVARSVGNTIRGQIYGNAEAHLQTPSCTEGATRSKQRGLLTIGARRHTGDWITPVSNASDQQIRKFLRPLSAVQAVAATSPQRKGGTCHHHFIDSIASKATGGNMPMGSSNGRKTA